MRRDALYQSSFVGHADNLLLSGIVRSTTIMKTVKIASPKVRAVHVPASGRCRFICYVSIEKIIEGKSTKGDVEALVGKPNSVGFYENKDELWSYAYAKFTMGMGSASHQGNQLSIRFDSKTGLVVQKGTGETMSGTPQPAPERQPSEK